MVPGNGLTIYLTASPRLGAPPATFGDRSRKGSRDRDSRFYELKRDRTII